MKTYTIVGGVNGTGKSSLIGVLRAIPDFGVIQETTLDSTEVTAAKAKEQGYYIQLFYVGLNTLDECLARIENRVKRGGHNVPANDVRKRFEERWEALKNVLPYCDEVLFFDNDNGFVEVAEYRNGEVVTIGELRPDWLVELQCFLREIWHNTRIGQ